jgi:hypothetical protein
MVCPTEKSDIARLMVANGVERLYMFVLVDGAAAEDATKSAFLSHRPFDGSRNVSAQSELVSR